MKAQKLVKLSFILTTIALASVVFYTLNVYYAAFFAVRGLQLSLAQFSVTVPNGTTAVMKAVLTLDNPSTYSFTIDEVHESLYLGDEFILAVAHTSMPKVTPRSNTTIEVYAPIPQIKLPSITEPGEKEWYLYTRVTLRGPLAGSFRLTSNDFVSS